jgi:acetyl-CoA acetyltransferase
MSDDVAHDFRDRFAIVGVGVTPTTRPPGADGRSAQHLEAWAIKLAMEDAGLQRDDVDGVVHAGAQVGSDTASRKLGLHSNFWFPIGRAASGIAGAFFATQALATGNATCVVVSLSFTMWSAAHGRQPVGAGRVVPQLAASSTKSDKAMTSRDGGGLVDLGWTAAPGAAAVHAWYAARHMHEFGTTPEQLGAVAIAHRAWANRNPDARFHDRPLTMEDYLASPWVVAPYRLMDNSVVSDVGCAFVVTTADRAVALRRKPAYIKGIGFGDAARKTWWDQTNFVQTDAAHAKDVAFRQAGITIEDVDVAEFYDCFTGEMIMFAEDYGYCDKGEGGPFIESGVTAPGGRRPMNTHGGLLSGYHCSDMGNVVEATLQLRGECGDRQVPGAEIAVANGHGGELVLPYLCPIHGTLVLGNARS